MKIMDVLKKLFGGEPAVDIGSLIENEAFLVDVRTPGEFAEGHVKGSVNIPLDTLPAQLNKFNNKKSIIVFCRSGVRSAEAKNILQKNGIDDVFNGGAWDYVNQFVS